MIILDTSIISELMRPVPDVNVVAWTEQEGRLHTTAVTLAEVDHGISRLPEGRRKDRLAAAAAKVFADFDDTILPFDARAARRFGGMVAGRVRAGRPIATAEAQIASICASREATLATRDTADFEATGVDLLNPWDS